MTLITKSPTRSRDEPVKQDLHEANAGRCSKVWVPASRPVLEQHWPELKASLDADDHLQPDDHQVNIDGEIGGVIGLDDKLPFVAGGMLKALDVTNILKLLIGAAVSLAAFFLGRRVEDEIAKDTADKILAHRVIEWAIL